MFDLILTRNAQDDAIEISEWYETQTQGTGERFLRALDRKFDSIRATPTIHRIVSGSTIRRSKLENWPYQVFFSLGDQVAIVIAIIHTSRDPLYISKRTETES
jgi:plasmid stabilization system protein ParE